MARSFEVTSGGGTRLSSGYFRRSLPGSRCGDYGLAGAPWSLSREPTCGSGCVSGWTGTHRTTHCLHVGGANSTVINPNVEGPWGGGTQGPPGRSDSVTGFICSRATLVFLPEPDFPSHGGIPSGNAEFIPVSEVEDIPTAEGLPANGDIPSNGNSGSSQNGEQLTAEESPATEPLTGTEGQSVEAVPAAVEGNQPNGSNPSAPEAAAETEETAAGKSLPNVTHVYGKKAGQSAFRNPFPPPSSVKRVYLRRQDIEWRCGPHPPRGALCNPMSNWPRCKTQSKP